MGELNQRSTIDQSKLKGQRILRKNKAIAEKKYKIMKYYALSLTRGRIKH